MYFQPTIGLLYHPVFVQTCCGSIGDALSQLWHTWKAYLGEKVPDVSVVYPLLLTGPADVVVNVSNWTGSDDCYAAHWSCWLTVMQTSLQKYCNTLCDTLIYKPSANVVQGDLNGTASSYGAISNNIEVASELTAVFLCLSKR